MNIETCTLSCILNNPDNYCEEEKVYGNYIVQGDFALIVGDTNSGKTLLASDIALANNDNLCYWDEQMNNKQRKAIIIDGEHNDSQIARRYEHLLTCASGDLIRGRFTEAEYDDCIEDKLLAIEKLIRKNSDAKLLIVDNLMCVLNNGNSVRQAQQFIQGLKRIKEMNDLTIILVAHLSKRNSKNPIEIKDILGSSVITNYADSIIAVGNTCEGDHIKYLKQLKSRSSIKMSEVAVLEIVEEPYLHFEFREYDMEENLLPKKVTNRSSISLSMGEMIYKLREEGLTVRSIAEQLNLSKSAVGRFLKN